MNKEFWHGTRGKVLLSLGATLIVVVIILGFIFLRESPTTLPESASFDITAEKESQAGIELDSGFFISTDTNLSLKDFRTLIYISPQQDFDLEKKDGGFYLKTQKPLEANTLYNLGIEKDADLPPLTWAFQTKGDFVVSSTMPGDNSQYVPLNTGIEVTFSQTAEDITKYFSISPLVEGTFENHGKTVAFVPKTPLEKDTIYTITISAGLASELGMTLASDYQFAFRTSTGEDNSSLANLYNSGTFTETFLPGDPVALAFYADDAFNETEFTVDIYKLDSMSVYLKLAQEEKDHINRILGRSDDYLLSTANLQKMSSFTSKLAKKENSIWYPGYVVLPENPGTGCYLVEITAQGNDSPTAGKKAQKLMQISELSLYMQSCNGETLLWLNDTASGDPMTGVDVTLGDIKGKTNQKGMASLETKDIKTAQVVINSSDGRSFGDILDLVPSQEKSLAEQYYTYLYTDREAYQPTDTVQFWGFVLPRQTGAAKPSKIQLTWNNQVIDLTVGEDGSFGGSISFANHISGGLNLGFTMDDKPLINSYVSIMEYVKPAFTFDLDFGKSYYRRDEPIKLDITASFFDGTPAPGVQTSIWPEVVGGSPVTDTSGKASVVVGPPDASNQSCQPRNCYVSVSSGGAEEESTYTSGSVLYFPSDYILTAKESDGKLQLQTNKIDYAKVDKAVDLWADFPDAITGEAANLSGAISIYKTEYIKEEAGEYYDFINKVTAKRYTYRQERTLVQEIPFTTENGTFTMDSQPYQSGDLKYYQAIINYTTPQENNPAFQEELYLGGGYWWPYDNIGEYYSFRLPNYLYSLKENQSATVTLYNNQEKAVTNGSLLYTVNQDKILTLETTTAGSFDLVYDKSYIPNCQIVGAYFDGKHIYAVTPLYIDFDPAERALDIAVTPDKDSYKPGDNVSLDLEVKDQSGNPVAATVLISVADEAAFAVMPQYVNPLQSVYHSVYYYPRSTFASYIQHNVDSIIGGAEGGGDGDGGGARQKFLDTAAFLTAQTGKDGKASVSFTLPDNLTSWRITSLAYTKDDSVFTGNSIDNISATLPFFLQMVANERYVAGDDITLSLRGFGTALNPDSTVDYTLQLSGNGTEKSEKYTGTGSQFTFCNLGSLPTGEYKLTLTAKSGSLSDTVEKTVSVVSSLAEVNISKLLTLGEEKTLQPQRYPVRLLIYDQENLQYFQALGNLLNNNGNRADQRIARDLAAQKIQELDPTATYAPDVTLSSIQNWDGGARLLPYGDSDVELTAVIAAAAPSYLDTQEAATYFYGVLNNTDSTYSEVASAYMGLAALKEPVLYDLRLLLAKSGELDLTDQISLATALALIGDTATAQNWYEQNITPLIQQNDPWKEVKQGSDETINAQLTNKATLLALATNQEDATALLQYLMDQPSSEELSLVQQMFFVHRYTPRSATESSFSYMLNGEKITADFEDGQVQVLELNQDALAALDLQQVSGKIGLTAYYTAAPSELAAVSDAVKITKSITPVSGKKLEPGATAKVTLHVEFSNDAPGGWYNVSDVIPSGFRFSKSDYSNTWYLFNQEGQRLSFSLNRNINRNYETTEAPELYSEMTITYYIRGVLPGKYLVEQAVIQHDQSALNNHSEKSSLIINQ